MAHRPIVAAIFNTSPDVIDLLRRALEPAGVVAISVLTFQIRDGQVDLESFLRQHDPDVIVYDVAPPYEANWHLFLHLSDVPSMRNRQVVLTSSNARQVEQLAGSNRAIYEVVGKPFDLERIVRAVKEAAHARPTK
jgi:CheY-like chemotaxis protein